MQRCTLEAENDEVISMISIILEHKLAILVFSETLAWILLIPMFYFRHWQRNNIGFFTFLGLSIFFGYVPHLTIPILSCIAENSFAALYESKDTLIFIIIIILLFIFGATKGKSLVLKIDHAMFEFAQKFKEKRKNH